MGEDTRAFGSPNRGSLHEMLPDLNENADNLETYIQMFGHLGGLTWTVEQWATAIIGPTGYALAVVEKTRTAEVLGYTTVNLTWLKRFRFTAEGF